MVTMKILNLDQALKQIKNVYIIETLLFVFFFLLPFSLPHFLFFQNHWRVSCNYTALSLKI